MSDVDNRFPQNPEHVTAPSPTIDMSELSELAAEDESGKGFIAKVIGIFLDDMAERVTGIGALLSSGDGVGIASRVHSLKGSCSHFGAERLIALCAEIERRALRAELEAIGPLIES